MQTITSCKREKIKLRGHTRYVYKQMGRAIADYDMLKNNDRILVAVSGGVDSLSLLKLFELRRQHVPIDFELVVCFVDTNFVEVDKDSLIEYFKDSGFDYVIKDLTLDSKDINCFWCSWNRRKALFEAARQYNCNKIALGHTQDDIIETTLMNIFFRAEISTCPPRLEMFGGQIQMIRPLCYLNKQEIVNFAENFPFPIAHYECPYGKTSKREYVKNMIKELEEESPFVRKNIFRALGKIKEGYLV